MMSSERAFKEPFADTTRTLEGSGDAGAEGRSVAH